jgi:hypothetical protein
MILIFKKIYISFYGLLITVHTRGRWSRNKVEPGNLVTGRVLRWTEKGRTYNMYIYFNSGISSSLLELLSHGLILTEPKRTIPMLIFWGELFPSCYSDCVTIPRLIFDYYTLNSSVQRERHLIGALSTILPGFKQTLNVIIINFPVKLIMFHFQLSNWLITDMQMRSEFPRSTGIFPYRFFWNTGASFP